VEPKLNVHTMGHNDGMEVQPQPELKPYIQCFWYFSGKASQISIINNHALADGCADLVFTRCVFEDAVGNKKELFFSQVMGPRTKATFLDVPQNADMLGIRFRPGCTGAFLGGLPMNQITDKSMELSNVWGNECKELEKQLWAIVDNVARIEFLEQAIEKKLDRKLLPDSATKEALLSIRSFLNRTPIAAIAQSVGISDRHLERKVKQYVGMSPKKYARITRIRQLIPILHQPSPPKLADIAHFGGFADQGHFSREFKEVTGISPKTYAQNSANVGFVQYDTHERW